MNQASAFYFGYPPWSIFSTEWRPIADTRRKFQAECAIAFIESAAIRYINYWLNAAPCQVTFFALIVASLLVVELCDHVYHEGAEEMCVSLIELCKHTELHKTMPSELKEWDEQWEPIERNEISGAMLCAVHGRAPA